MLGYLALCSWSVLGHISLIVFVILIIVLVAAVALRFCLDWGIVGLCTVSLAATCARSCRSALIAAALGAVALITSLALGTIALIAALALGTVPLVAALALGTGPLIALTLRSLAVTVALVTLALGTVALIALTLRSLAVTVSLVALALGTVPLIALTLRSLAVAVALVTLALGTIALIALTLRSLAVTVALVALTLGSALVVAVSLVALTLGSVLVVTVALVALALGSVLVVTVSLVTLALRSALAVTVSLIASIRLRSAGRILMAGRRSCRSYWCRWSRRSCCWLWSAGPTVVACRGRSRRCLCPVSRIVCGHVLCLHSCAVCVVAVTCRCRTSLGSLRLALRSAARTLALALLLWTLGAYLLLGVLRTEHHRLFLRRFPLWFCRRSCRRLRLGSRCLRVSGRRLRMGGRCGWRRMIRLRRVGACRCMVSAIYPANGCHLVVTYIGRVALNVKIIFLQYFQHLFA